MNYCQYLFVKGPKKGTRSCCVEIQSQMLYCKIHDAQMLKQKSKNNKSESDIFLLNSTIVNPIDSKNINKLSTSVINVDKSSDISKLGNGDISSFDHDINQNTDDIGNLSVLLKSTTPKSKPNQQPEKNDSCNVDQMDIKAKRKYTKKSDIKTVANGDKPNVADTTNLLTDTQRSSETVEKTKRKYVANTSKGSIQNTTDTNNLLTDTQSSEPVEKTKRKYVKKTDTTASEEPNLTQSSTIENRETKPIKKNDEKNIQKGINPKNYLEKNDTINTKLIASSLSIKETKIKNKEALVVESLNKYKSPKAQKITTHVTLSPRRNVATECDENNTAQQFDSCTISEVPLEIGSSSTTLDTDSQLEYTHKKKDNIQEYIATLERIFVF